MIRILICVRQVTVLVQIDYIVMHKFTIKLIWVICYFFLKKYQIVVKINSYVVVYIIRYGFICNISLVCVLIM